MSGFYGRRKGKALRPGQDRLVRELLPRLAVAQAPIRPADLFEARYGRFRLEIGFGGGEHLLHRAREEPATGFIGCEPFVNGMAKLLAAVEREGLGNLRVFDRDAAELVARLPDATLEGVDILYPDPWPKRRQRKRRLVSDEMLAALARVTRPGGTLRFATDIDDYAGWALARVRRSPDWDWPARRADDWRLPFAGWPGTRYEAKALKEGRRPVYLTFVRRSADAITRRPSAMHVPARP